MLKLLVITLLLIVPALSQEKSKCIPSPNLGRCFNGERKTVLNQKIENLDLSESNLYRATIDRVKVSKFKMEKVNFRFGKWLRSSSPFLRWAEVDLRASTIQNVFLDNFSIQESDFRGSKISWSHFKNGDFLKSKFKDAIITDSIFENCVLPPGFFEEAITVNVTFIECRIQK